MKIRRGLFSTNQVTLNGLAMTVGALVSYVDQTWRTGQPMFISHDMHRPVGWSSTEGLLITPDLVGVLGAAHLADTDGDMDRVANAARSYLNDKYLAVSPEDTDSLKAAIGIPLKEDTQVVRLEAVSVIEDGLAARLHPELFTTSQDKYGLTDLARLKQVAPGVYEVGGLLLFAHRNFRRSMSHLNNLNGEFLLHLGQCAESEWLQVKVALDPDRVGLPGTWREPIELQYWWGPRFNDKLPEIVDQVTRHEANTELRVYHGINRMEFWWHSQEGRKTLEAEEVLDKPSWGLSSDEYACRYVHSMLDTATGRPNHLDGAVRIYDTEKLLARLGESINDSGRSTQYKKLWRIDGPLDVPIWKSLISHFYRDNRLVGEYFEGVDTVMVADDAPVTDVTPDTLGAYLPLCMEANDGVLLTVNFEPLKSATSVESIHVEARQWFKTHEERNPCIELSALDFVKRLRIKHPNLRLPEGCHYMAIEDMDINLPRVSHSSTDAAFIATESLQALADFTSLLAARSSDRFVTAELSVWFPDRQANFSFAGFVEPLHRLLEKLGPLPGNLNDLATWCELAHLSAKDLWPLARYSHKHLNLVGPNGSLILQRTPATVEPIPGSDGKYGITVGMSGSLKDALDSGRICAVPQIEVRTATCSGCGGIYFDCACTALLTDDCTLRVQDCEICGYVWTARPA